MSMLSIFNKNGSTIATSQLVYSPDDLGVFESLLNKVKQLDQKLAQADKEIEEAKAQAQEEGQRAGFKHGRSIARRKISLALLASQREVCEQKNHMHETSVQLALEIVRRIGLNCPVPETLVSLAMHSARELEPNEKASLCVHPDIEQAVRERLASLSQENIPWLIDVTADASLEPDNCFLKTSHGSLFVGLESQLRVIERSLHERIS